MTESEKQETESEWKSETEREKCPLQTHHLSVNDAKEL